MRVKWSFFMISIMAFWGTLVVASAGLVQGGALEQTRELEAIQKSIQDNGYHWQAGETSVSGLAPEEKKALLGLRLPPDYQEIRSQWPRWPSPELSAVYPQIFDWREMEGVSAVKNQKSCGSCWAFCSVAAFEAMILIYDGIEEDLSEQQMLSCNSHGHGCDGGWMSTVYELCQDPGAVGETCMPYKASDNIYCKQQYCEVVAQLDTWLAVDNSVSAIKSALQVGPVACTMTVYDDFFYYQGGCYEHEGDDPINHGVLIVGWDDTICDGQGAWIAKNSWGTDWGLDGFFYIKYGSCRIGYATDLVVYTPRFPVVRYDGYGIQDDLGDGDARLDPGETATVPITLKNMSRFTATGVGATLSTTTQGISILDGQAEFGDIPPRSSTGSIPPHFTVQLSGGVSSGTIVYFRLFVTTDEDSCDYYFSVPVGDVTFYDDAELTRGWVLGVPDDDAQDGMWARGIPQADGYQPGADHTPSWGEFCFVTGVQANHEVWDGKTTLLSPMVDLSQCGQPQLSYWRYYYDNPGDDDFVVDISCDGGKTWANLETIHGGAVGWRQQSFLVEDFVALTDSVRLRFVAQDKPNNSRCEVLVDDMVFLDLDRPIRPQAVSQLRVFLAGGSNIRLVWSPVTQDEEGKEIVVDHYSVYRQTEPDFSIEEAEPVAICSDTSFLDVGAARTACSYFYAITATAEGWESVVSVRSGEFDRYVQRWK